ncbi:Uncharacterised protein [Enterobacter cloacae]|nr:Uncharacterised protein [Enterobacter cloacae]
MTTKKADYIWFNGEMVRSVATTLTKDQWCSATVNTCSVCMTQPKFIVSRSPKALMS